MKVAIAQMNTRPGDFVSTVEAMLAYGRRAKASGADLLVFPAPAFMGTDPMALLDRAAYVEEAAFGLERLASELEVTSLVPYLYSFEGASGFDVAFIRNGSLTSLTVQAMQGLVAPPDPDTPMSPAGEDVLDDDDPERFMRSLMEQLGVSMASQELGTSSAAAFDAASAEGASMPLGPWVFGIDDIDVGVVMGAEGLDAFAKGDLAADVVCLIPTEGYNTDDEATALAPAVSDGCFGRAASDANCWLVAANAAGAYEDCVYCGSSFVLAPWGELVGVAASCAEDLLVSEFEVMDEGPLAEPACAPSYDRTGLLWEACRLAVRDRVAKTQAHGAALVLDGTMASCALAALATDALGPLRVRAVICAADDEGSSLARQCAKALTIREVDELSRRCAQDAASTLGLEGDESDALRALAALRLGALARAEGLVPLVALDKTALATDAHLAASGLVAGAYAPFGDVYRSDVARLARRRNMASPVIPTQALRRLAVPEGLGLEELSREPEGMLSELDAALLGYVERSCDVRDLAQGRLGVSLAERIAARVRLGEVARRQGPSYPVFSARSLAEASRPVTDVWEDLAQPRAPSGRVAPMQLTLGAPPAAEGEATSASVPRPRPWEPGRAEGTRERQEGSARTAEQVMGFLQELAAGQRLVDSQAEKGGRAQGPWPWAMFSDN